MGASYLKNRVGVKKAAGVRVNFFSDYVDTTDTWENSCSDTGFSVAVGE
jgi:hypothetical protein